MGIFDLFKKAKDWAEIDGPNHGDSLPEDDEDELFVASERDATTAERRAREAAQIRDAAHEVARAHHEKIEQANANDQTSANRGRYTKKLALKALA